MKHAFIKIAFVALMGGILITGCQPSAKKVESAKEDLNSAKEDVVVAQQDYNQAVKDSLVQFKKVSEARISDNEKLIAELKANLNKQQKAIQIKYEKTVTDLEQQNNNLKQKLADFKDEEESKWQSFKREFNYDMDELGKSLKGLVIDDKD